jgi:hypothetical protein
MQMFNYITFRGQYTLLKFRPYPLQFLYVLIIHIQFIYPLWDGKSNPLFESSLDIPFEDMYVKILKMSEQDSPHLYMQIFSE